MKTALLTQSTDNLTENTELSRWRHSLQLASFILALNET